MSRPLRALSASMLTVALVTVLGSCTDKREVEDVADVLSLDDIDQTNLEPNSCGGIEVLEYQGFRVEPGESCGLCDDGVIVCAGNEAVECVGASEINACGSCGPLQGTPGRTCGVCGFGAWECEAGELSCDGDRPVNACGGCAVLPADPGQDCSSGRIDSTWRCVSPEEVRCVPDNANVCGGNLELEAVPGELCGTCNRGTTVCSGTDALGCLNPDEGVNLCGGCDELPGEEGAPCGECGGFYRCTQDGGMTCSRVRNACGGCADLDGQPGQACPGGNWICAQPNVVACVGEGQNACGGQSDLEALPGSPCGACNDGRFVCSSPEGVVCVDASAPNSCDGCGPMPGEPGDTCAAGAVFVCAGGTTECSIDIGLNECGGTGELPGAPGDPCGICGTGQLACAGANALACTEEDPAELYTFWPDIDEDTFGDEDADSTIICEGEDTTGFVQNNADCNDESDLFFPDAFEDECTATEDYNCDGVVLFTDNDRDGVSECFDCDDSSRRVYPDAPEICDGIDNDCDEDIDEGAGRTWYLDADGDRRGDPETTVLACEQPDGYVSRDDDCDDTDDRRYPGNAEVCDGVDNDCDTIVDGESAIDRSEWFRDADEDGFGDPRTEPLIACDQPVGYVADAQDCRDDSDAVFPGAIEVCDGADNNCDTVVDADAADRESLYVDADGDGFGDPAREVFACPGPGFVANALDCNDRRADVNPDALEVFGDGVDQTCDGREVCFVDVDGDGFVGSFDITVETSDLTCSSLVLCPDGLAAVRPDGRCQLNPGLSALLDCRDDDPLISPAAREEFGDGVDQNCDGTEICYRDADEDGFRPDAFAIQVSEDFDCNDFGEALAVEPTGDCWDEGDPVVLTPDSTPTGPYGDFGERSIRPDQVFPGASELAAGDPASAALNFDGVDYDCSGDTFCFVNQDSDSHRTNTRTLVTSSNVTNMCESTDRSTWVAPVEDDRCDPYDYINPDQIDASYDGTDTNCDGTEVCYHDRDDDNFRPPADSLENTDNPVSVARAGTQVFGICDVAGAADQTVPAGDCYDEESGINPAANDAPGIDFPSSSATRPVEGGTEAANAEFDVDCDGRDADVDSTIYVYQDNPGSPSATIGCQNGYTSISCSSLQQAVDACDADSSCARVLAGVGIYPDSGQIRTGTTSIYGSYNVSSRAIGGDLTYSARYDDATTANNSRRTRVEFALGTERGLYIDNPSSTLTLDRLSFAGADVSGESASGWGKPTAAIYVQGSSGRRANVRMNAVHAEGGNAGNGRNGSSGSGGSRNGSSGADGGGSACGSTGGAGGYRSRQGDTSCGLQCGCFACVCPSIKVSVSGYGSVSPRRGSGPGGGGTGTHYSYARVACTACIFGCPGGRSNGGGGGNGSNGGNGGRGSQSSDTDGSWSGGWWSGSRGNSGNSGTNGGGGGGGGKGQGCYLCCSEFDSGSEHRGGNGGRGGGGGCGGGGGTGGYQGGASFGIYSYYGNLAMSDVDVAAGSGGNGGTGGAGARGGNGGSGQGGSNGPDCAGNGGSGGHGGAGGGGGGGAGGNSGPSIGIALAGGNICNSAFGSCGASLPSGSTSAGGSTGLVGNGAGGGQQGTRSDGTGGAGGNGGQNGRSGLVTGVHRFF